MHFHTAGSPSALGCPHCRALSRTGGARPTARRSETLRASVGSAENKIAGRGVGVGAQDARLGVPALRRGRILIKGGIILSMDPAIGNLPVGDVLVEDSKIVAVGASIDAGDAQILDASNTIVMPGFIDTHRHMWQGFLRTFTPDGDLGDYLRNALTAVAPHFTADDVYAGNLLSAAGALNAGITTVLDWSHISNTPEHSDAAIQALRDSGMRAVYAYSHANCAPDDKRHRYPDDIRRIRKQHFSSSEDLVTLAMAVAGPEFGSPERAVLEWDIAREVGARITTHIGVSTFGQQGKFEQLSKLVKLSDDATYIHCSTLNETEWKIIRDTGGTISIAPEVEMNMGHGMPPIQKALDLGIRPSISIDVETNVGTDMFSQMRFIAALQRAMSFERGLAGDSNAPARLTSQQVLEFATIEGARANGLAHRTGSLTVGKDADIILLRTDLLNVAPINDAAGAVVHAMDGSNVDTILVAGNPVKVGGKIVGLDVTAIIDAAGKARDRAVERSGFSKPLVN